jgi:PAS domain S-box-containing protein
MKNKPAIETASTIRHLRDQASHDRVRLEALFSSIGEGVVASDENGIITRANQTALELLGKKRSDLIGKRFIEAIVSVHDNGTPLSPYERPIVKAFQEGKTISTRTLYLRSDDSLLPAQVTVSPIIYRNKPIGAIEVFRDLTGEIESDKLKSDFISIASHQLRTPLSAINMYTRMLRDGLAGEMNPEQLPYIETILNSVERMNVLIDTLLNITRIEAGGITIKPRSVNLGELAQEILVEFQPAASSKSIGLTSNIPTNIKPIKTDSLLAKEVCANLLSNAIKYTPDGGKVHLELADTGDEIRFTVRDTGYGIPESAQKNIFLKFFRAENITNKDVSGTGLGLYLIKNIAESLGGELWFESTENVGSTFYFTLPKEV